MKVVGLDLSLRATGVCVLSEDPLDPIETFLIPGKKTRDPEELIQRLCATTSEIIRIVKDRGIQNVVIEAPAANQKWRAAEVGEIHGAVKMQLYLAAGIVPVSAQATAMRLHVIGNIEKSFEMVPNKRGRMVRKVCYGEVSGKRGKKRKATVKDIIEARLQERGLSFPSQDEMDAYVAARYLLDRILVKADDNERPKPGMAQRKRRKQG